MAYTFFSPSAEGLAERMPAQVTAYLPWDLRGPTSRVLDAVRPDALVFTKTEVWPVLTAEAADHRLHPVETQRIPLGPVLVQLADGIAGVGQRRIDVEQVVDAGEWRCFQARPAPAVFKPQVSHEVVAGLHLVGVVGIKAGGVQHVEADKQ